MKILTFFCGKLKEEIVRLDGDNNFALVDLKGGPFAKVVYA
jgi:hypothetical protein